MIARAARRRLLIFTFWPLFGAFSGLQIQISMLSHHHSWLAVISYQVLVWSLWIPITLAIGALLREASLRRFTPAAVVLHAAVALVFGITHVAAWIAIVACQFGPVAISTASISPRSSSSRKSRNIKQL